MADVMTPEQRSRCMAAIKGKDKIARNIKRDCRTPAEHYKLGWRVLRIWECGIKTMARREETLERLYQQIISIASPMVQILENYNVPAAAEPEASYGESD